MRSLSLSLLIGLSIGCTAGGGDVDGVDPTLAGDTFQLLGGSAAFEEYPNIGWVLEVQVQVVDPAEHVGGTFEYLVFEGDSEVHDFTLAADDGAYLWWEDDTVVMALSEVDPDLAYELEVRAYDASGEDEAGPLVLSVEPI